MVFHHVELQLKSKSSQQWTLPLRFKNEATEISHFCNAVIIIFLSLSCAPNYKQCGTIIHSSAVVYLIFMTMEQNVSVEKNRASLFSYNLGHIFFVVAAKQFLLTEIKMLVPPEAIGE